MENQSQLIPKEIDDLGFTFDDSNWNNKNKTFEEKRLLSYRGTILSMRQKLDLNIKVQMARRRIKEVVTEYGENNCVISFSGGKDSTILSHISTSLGYKTSHLFMNTRIEYPECVEFTKEWCNRNMLNLIELFPEVKPIEIWKKYGFPMFSKEIAEILERIRNGQKVSEIKLRKVKSYMKYKDVFLSAKCCDYLKKIPINQYFKNCDKKVSILGTTAEESQVRRLTWIRKGCIYHSKNQIICNPLIFFTEKDIWEYANKYNIKFASIYYNGIRRNGCYCCGFGCHLTEQNNFYHLKRLYPTIYDAVMNKWGFKQICKECDITWK